MNIGCLRKSIQYHKSRIVAGHLVLVADIAQTNNQVFVHYSEIKPPHPQQQRWQQQNEKHE